MEVDIPEKLQPLLDPGRIKVARGGRGGTKSWTFAAVLLAMGIQRPLRVLCTREIQRSLRQSVHQLLKDTIIRHGWGDFYHPLDTEIRGKHNQTLFMYDGLQAHTVDTIKSYEGVDIVWVEEGQTVAARSWQILLPTIRKPGSEIWVSMNPKLKSDPAWQLFIASKRSDVVDMVINFEDNPWLSEELRQEQQHAKETMDEETYANVWGGEPKGSVEGSIYGRQLAHMRRTGRIGGVPPHPRLVLNAFMDLGTSVGNATAVWLHQRTGTQHRFVKYWAEHGKGMEYWWDLMNDWRLEKGLRWGTIYMPHDGKANMQGAQLTNRQVILEDLIARDKGGADVIVIPRTTDLGAAIDLTRSRMGDAWIDEAECMDGINALEHYAYEWDEDAQIFRKQPAHTWASNGADAFRQWAQGFDDEQDRAPRGEAISLVRGGY